MTTQHELLEFARTYLKSVLVEAAESLDIGFDSSTPFGELGIDSFRVLRIVKALETDFGRLPKTLLFENYHVDDLAAYFVEHHGDTLLDLAVRHTSVREAGNAVVAGRPRAVRPHDDAQTPAMVAAGPVLALESQARADSRLGEWVRSLFETHKNDG